MVTQGRVLNGVVVLADGVRLPEGQDVTIFAPSPSVSKTHSILDIPTVSLGSLQRPFADGEGLLDEMLEGRS